MTSQNPYAAPQTIQLSMAAEQPAPVIDEALLPVIHGAGICHRALTFLVGSFGACITLALMLMGGTFNFFLGLFAAGCLVAAVMHLRGLARLRTAPQESRAGWLLTVSLCLGLLYFGFQFLAPLAFYLQGWTQYISAVAWGAVLSSLGSFVFLLLGIQRLGCYAKNLEILVPCRLAMLCLCLSYGVAIAFALIKLYPEQSQRLGLHRYFEDVTFVSVGMVALILLMVIMGLAFYGAALYKLINLNRAVQAIHLETPEHLEDEGATLQSASKAAAEEKYDFLE